MVSSGRFGERLLVFLFQIGEGFQPLLKSIRLGEPTVLYKSIAGEKKWVRVARIERCWWGVAATKQVGQQINGIGDIQGRVAVAVHSLFTKCVLATK